MDNTSPVTENKSEESSNKKASKLEEIDDLLRMIEVHLLSRKPITTQRWKRLCQMKKKHTGSCLVDSINRLLEIGSFDVAKVIRRREEEWNDGFKY